MCSGRSKFKIHLHRDKRAEVGKPIMIQCAYKTLFHHISIPGEPSIQPNVCLFKLKAHSKVNSIEKTASFSF